MSRALMYLLAIEDVVRSPLIHAQTLPLLRHLARSSDWDPILASAYPLPNYWRFRHQRQQLKTTLAADDITLDVLPIAFLTRHFHIPARLLPWYKTQARAAAHILARRHSPRLIHARAYPAALLGLYLKQRTRAPLIFDARSLYIQEGEVVAEGGKGVMFGPRDVAAWKQEEARLMAASDAITVVSQPMADILAHAYPQVADKIHTIPIAARVPDWSALHDWRRRMRPRLGFGPDARVLVYLGSWFEPDLVLPIVERLHRLRPDIQWELLLLVAHAPAGMEEGVAARLGGTIPVHHLSVPHQEVQFHLAAADLAILPQAEGPRLTHPAYRQRARSVLSIKFTEYLAAGLPVLAARNWAGAAADIVAEEDVGAVYDDLSDTALRAWVERWRAEAEAMRKRAWRYARHTFHPDVVFSQYQALYDRLPS